MTETQSKDSKDATFCQRCNSMPHVRDIIRGTIQLALEMTSICAYTPLCMLANIKFCFYRLCEQRVWIFMWLCVSGRLWIRNALRSISAHWRFAIKHARYLGYRGYYINTCTTQMISRFGETDFCANKNYEKKTFRSNGTVGNSPPPVPQLTDLFH